MLDYSEFDIDNLKRQATVWVMDLKLTLSTGIGVLVGALLTWAMLDTVGVPDRQARAAAGDGALLEGLRELQSSQARTADALETLAAAISDEALAPLPPEHIRVAAEPGDPISLDELTASLDALRASIEVESRRTQDVIRSAPAFGGESLSKLRARSTDTDWNKLETLEQDWRSDPSAAARKQYFQSAADLLEAYGPPNAIYRPKGGLHYVYRRHAEDDAGVAWYFRLQDGYVVNFFVEDEPAKNP